MKSNDEGILLKVVSDNAKKRFIVAFTSELGLIEATTSQNKLLPFERYELTFLEKSRTGKKILIDAKPMFPLSNTRESLVAISLAGKLSSLILKTQMPGKANPRLYELFKAFLKKTNQTTNESAFISAFILKLLELEGLLDKVKEPSKLMHCKTFSEINNFTISSEEEKRIAGLLALLD